MAAADVADDALVRDGIRCMLLRGGTSKGAYFVAEDVPADPRVRDDLLLRIMGSPDPRQIDGIGGAHPLTSKVAIVSRSAEEGIDVDYLFLQVGVDEPVVSDRQTCGNLLAGVGPFAIERGLVAAGGDEASVRIRLVNTGDVAVARFPLSAGRPDYAGDQAIDGVPGTAALISLEMSSGGRPLLPTGSVTDEIAGHHVTLVDNGMPVVLLVAEEFGVGGDETPAELEERADLREEVECVRLAAGPLMGLGDVAQQTVPKMILVSAPSAGGAISTRSFIPARVHSSIGVLMAASVAAALHIPGAVGADLARLPASGPVEVEHPSGSFPSLVNVTRARDTWTATSTSIRTARKLFDGRVFPRPRTAPPREDTR